MSLARLREGCARHWAFGNVVFFFSVTAHRRQPNGGIGRSCNKRTIFLPSIFTTWQHDAYEHRYTIIATEGLDEGGRDKEPCETRRDS
jgi:hypothetical protein